MIYLKKRIRKVEDIFTFLIYIAANYMCLMADFLQNEFHEGNVILVKIN